MRFSLFFVIVVEFSNLLSAKTVEESAEDAPLGQIPAGEALLALELKEVGGEIIKRTNQFRLRKELSALSGNKTLDEAAQKFAEFMARTGKYGHHADGKRPSQRVRQAGYDYCLVLENIAYCYRSTGYKTAKLANGFVLDWIKSPEHLENILYSNVTETGIGIAQANDGKTYFAVQLFALPREIQLEFQVENQTDQTIQYSLVVRAKDSERMIDSAPGIIRTHYSCQKVEIIFPEPIKQKYPVTEDSTFIVKAGIDGNLQVTIQQHNPSERTSRRSLTKKSNNNQPQVDSQ